MKDFQKTLKELRELSTINEETKALLEKMTGKELVDYESIDALVGALMTHYNGELKKKATTSHSHTWLEVTSKPTTFPPSLHNHDERYYTEEEIDTKFKNYPVPVGGILLMYNTSNPAELYIGTMWELIASDKYLKTTTGTPLSMGGSNSFSIQKANLPAIKLKNDTVSATIPVHFHYEFADERSTPVIYSQKNISSTQYARRTVWREGWAESYNISGTSVNATLGKTSNNGSGNTGNISSYTENLGSGTAISISPTYITIRAWKRLT